jgi:hypothetical protein
MLAAISLIPATIFLVIGYFVLFSSTRAQGRVKRFGSILAVWMFVLSGATVAGGLVAPQIGLNGPFAHMQRMEQMQQQQLEQLQQLRQD